MKRILSALLFLCVTAGSSIAASQAVERPEAFDPAGRISAITPPMAARLALGPPAWRITGDYREARLFRLSDEAFVIVVTRRDGTVERYSITAADREYLRQRTATLPPGFEEQFGLAAQRAAAVIRNDRFVLTQSLLGLTVYAPAFAGAISNDNAGRLAGYLLAAGASFFGASEIARRIEITPAQNGYAAAGGLHGALGGWGLTYALGGNDRAQAAGTLFGGLGGVAAGLALGADRSVDEVHATIFGAHAGVGLALLAQYGMRGNEPVLEPGLGEVNEPHPTRAEAAALVGAGLAGHQLGALYPRLVPYNVTAGDVEALRVTGLVGMLAGSIAISNRDPGNAAVATALGAGLLGGIVAGDRLLVRRFDYSTGDAGFLALGAGAGALMGAGLYVLVDRERDDDAVARSLATAGAAGGIVASSWYINASRDRGSPFARLQFTPGNAALALAGVRGVHSIASLRF